MVLEHLYHFGMSFGSVKTIRTCQPQTSSGGASSASRSGKSENIHFTNKVRRQAAIYLLGAGCLWQFFC